MKKRSLKDTSKLVESAIRDIRKVLDAVPIISGYDFFDHEKFKYSGLDKLIKMKCKEYDVNEDHIRKVAGWQ